MAKGLEVLRNPGEAGGIYLTSTLRQFFGRCEEEVVGLEALENAFGVVAVLYRSESKYGLSYVVDRKGRLFEVGPKGTVLEASAEINIYHPDNQDWVAMLLDAAEERMGAPEGQQPVAYTTRRGKGPSYKSEDDYYDAPNTSYNIDNNDITAWPGDRLPAHERA